MKTSQQLSDFLLGQTAQVLRLELPDAEAQRLRSMGIFEGQQIKICKTGGNLIVTAAGGRIALANRVARHILARPTDQQAA